MLRWPRSRLWELLRPRKSAHGYSETSSPRKALNTHLHRLLDFFPSPTRLLSMLCARFARRGVPQRVLWHDARSPTPRRALHASLSPLSSSSPKPAPPSSSRRTGPRYNYLRASNPFDPVPVDPNTSTYRFVTARDLVRLREPPTRVRMLARDFIDDALYNPNYGYFATKVEIFDPDVAKVRQAGKGKGKGKEVNAREDVLAAASRAEGFDFGVFRNTAEFEDEVARRYMVFEGRGSGHEGEEMAEGVTVGSGVGRQVWHTPTELFKVRWLAVVSLGRFARLTMVCSCHIRAQPWYGRALARFLCASYKLNLFPYHDLVIYEIGAGNGTLMGDILDYLAAHEPEVYSRTRYRIIEISERLQGMQRGRAAGGRPRTSAGGDAGAAELGREKARQRGHEGKVEIIGKSIFEWDRVVHEPCFFLAMEVMVRCRPLLRAFASCSLTADPHTSSCAPTSRRTISLTTSCDTRPTRTNRCSASSRSTRQATTPSCTSRSPTRSSRGTSPCAPVSPLFGLARPPHPPSTRSSPRPLSSARSTRPCPSHPTSRSPSSSRRGNWSCSRS